MRLQLSGRFRFSFVMLVLKVVYSGLLHRRWMREDWLRRGLTLLGRRNRGRVGEPLHLQGPRGLDERGEVLLEDVDLTIVHVLQELLKVLRQDVLEEHDGVL
jgi:hypothetical protein